MGVSHAAFSDLLAAAQSLDLNIDTGDTVTVMFTDIVGSTALAEALGDAPWARFVTAHVGQITQAVQAQRGRVIKSLGDGTMSTFPTASAGLRAGSAVVTRRSPARRAATSARSPRRTARR